MTASVPGTGITEETTTSEADPRPVWVRFSFSDADPVAECECGWRIVGDAVVDAFRGWWVHRRSHDLAAAVPLLRAEWEREQGSAVERLRDAQAENERLIGGQCVRELVEALTAARAEADRLRQTIAAVRALCDANDEASLRPACPDFEPIAVPWTVALRAALAAAGPDGEQR